MAAFLMTRLMAHELDEDRQRNLFPSHIDVHEARYWCWAQLSPQSPTFPCPVPFTANLPASTLCWTDWPGAEWDVGWEPHGYWMRINRVGAIRWAGVSRWGQEFRWNVSPDELRRWDPEVAALNVPELEKTTHILHTIADLVLMRLAAKRFALGDSR